jgi:hypothetical protein
MSKKPPALDIKKEMSAFDRKQRDFLETLTPEESKAFSAFMMIRWGATVQGSPELQEWYLRATNENLNKHFFDISSTKHEKLHWLSATTVSPGMGTKYHPWLGLKKKTKDNKAVNFLRTLYPHLKEDDIKLLVDINDKDNLKDMARELGWDDKRIKSDL